MAAVKSNSKNTAQVLIDLCGEEYALNSNEVTVEKVFLTVTKQANCRFVIPGNTVQFCVHVKNDSDFALDNARFFDHLDVDATYVDGTFTVNGSPAVPTVQGRDISYYIPSLPPHSDTVICFKVKII